MIAKPIYEVLPTIYLAIATVTIILTSQPVAACFAALIFLLDARIYTLRSQNPRSDNPKRRKPG